MEDIAVVDALAGHDEKQVELMEERIVVVDEEDRVVRPGSKKECHLNKNIAQGLLHRAFSVFLFDLEGRLLLQQRSDKKITFPLYWANSCCSHPLHTPDELEEEDGLGVKRAAVRKLGQELGIPPEELPIDEMVYLTRIHYKAQESGPWGEHEMDYVIVLQAAVTLQPDPNEVKEARYFTEEELDTFLFSAEEKQVFVSPWFRHIQSMFLKKWWAALRDGTVASHKDHATIHRVGRSPSSNSTTP